MSFKRVRFQEPEEDFKESTSFLKLKRRRTTQRTILPGHEQEDDEFEGELTQGYRGMADVEDLLWDEENEQGPIKAVNPERAAAKRAARRKDFAKLARKEGGGLLDDVSAAEAEYEAHEGFWDNSGVPIEPFHLRQEREAGFFDDEGNYIAYKDDLPEDAWLESLPKGVDAQEDTTEAASGNMQGHPSHEVEPPEPPSNEALRCYKEGLIDLLRPGESVFDALRRLGNLQGSRKQVMQLAHRERMRSGRTVPSENRDAFDRLTEFSNILLENGDYHVHTNQKEQLQHDLCTHASGIRFGMDPNADAEGEQSWRSFAARLAVPPQPLPSGGQQSAAAVSAEGGDHSQSATTRASPALPADPDEDIFASEEPEQLKEGSLHQSQTNTAPLACQMQKVTMDNPGYSSDMEGGHASIEDSQCPVGIDPADQGDVDPMRLLEQQALEAAAGHPLQGSFMAMEAQLPGVDLTHLQPEADAEDSHIQSAGVPQALSAPASGVPSSTHCGSLQWDAQGDDVEQQDTGESGAALEMEGFSYDQASGFLYNSAMGAFYDPAKRLFGDASSGLWYSLQDGMYRLVS